MKWSCIGYLSLPMRRDTGCRIWVLSSGRGIRRPWCENGKMRTSRQTLLREHIVIILAEEWHGHRHWLHWKVPLLVGIDSPRDADGSLEHQRLRVALALPFRLDAIIAYRFLFATLDAASPARYHSWLPMNSLVSVLTYLGIQSWCAVC